MQGLRACRGAMPHLSAPRPHSFPASGCRSGCLCGCLFHRCGQNAGPAASSRPVPQGGSGYGAKANDNAQHARVENEDQIQCLVRFASGTEGTIIMDGERFNELKIPRFTDPKPDRGFKTILAGSQIPQFSGFFGFDFAGGGLCYFDVKVIEVHDLIMGIAGASDCFPDFKFGVANQRIMAAMERSLATRAWEAVKA